MSFTVHTYWCRYPYKDGNELSTNITLAAGWTRSGAPVPSDTWWRRIQRPLLSMHLPSTLPSPSDQRHSYAADCPTTHHLCHVTLSNHTSLQCPGGGVEDAAPVLVDRADLDPDRTSDMPLVSPSCRHSGGSHALLLTDHHCLFHVRGEEGRPALWW